MSWVFAVVYHSLVGRIYIGCCGAQTPREFLEPRCPHTRLSVPWTEPHHRDRRTLRELSVRGLDWELVIETKMLFV